MSNDNTATDQVTETEEDRLFEEFAGDGQAHAEPPAAQDDSFDDENGDQEKPRDDQGRFATEEDDQGGDDDQGEQQPQETAEQRLERLEREAEQWRHRYQSDLGRQNALQRKIQQLEQEKQQLQQQPQPSGEGEGDDNPEGSGMSDAEWETLKKDFPEIAAGIDQQLSRVTQQYESRIQQLETQLTPIQQQAEAQAQVAEENALASQHPDWRETINTNDFHAWLSEQPQTVQELTNSPYAADAAYLLTSFKVMTGRNRQSGNADQARRQRRLQSAQTVPSRGGRQRSDVPEGDEDALFDYFAERADG